MCAEPFVIFCATHGCANAVTSGEKMFLSKIPEKVFESTGSVIGIGALLLIVKQIHAEWVNPDATTLSPVFVAGFMVNYLFWCLYGIRFRRFAMWFVNGLAMILQLCLLIVSRY